MDFFCIDMLYQNFREVYQQCPQITLERRAKSFLHVILDFHADTSEVLV